MAPLHFPTALVCEEVPDSPLFATGGLVGYVPSTCESPLPRPEDLVLQRVDPGIWFLSFLALRVVRSVVGIDGTRISLIVLDHRLVFSNSPY